MVCVVYMCCCLRDVKIQDGQKSLNFDPCPFFGGGDPKCRKNTFVAADVHTACSNDVKLNGFGGLSDMLYIFWFHLGRKWMKRSLELCKAETCHVASGLQAGIDQKNLKGSKGGRCKTVLICQDWCQPTNSNQFILHIFAKSWNILESECLPTL